MQQSLSLYIHMPWCIRKCPYCDFNSHKSPDLIPEEQYISALTADLQEDLLKYPGRTLESIFIGGGTPSLFSAKSYELLFHNIQKMLPFPSSLEITLEANPGTVDYQQFSDYRALGINRLSLGIQSFNPAHLRSLGRIHDEKQAHNAIESARKAGFDNMNIDIMHGLPQQSVSEGIADLRQALSYQPEHLSWYQLTIEPNTLFYRQRPTLPTEDDAFALEEAGFSLLEERSFHHYEISAFCQKDKWSRHNLNYWLFGDYLGIGAGAHGKLTSIDGNKIIRTRKHRQPQDYLNPTKSFLAAEDMLSPKDLVFEFILNATRLNQTIPLDFFTQRTGLPLDNLMPGLIKAKSKGLITINSKYWKVTPLGRNFTNDLQGLFLEG